MRGLAKNYMKRGQKDIYTLRLYERIGQGADSLKNRFRKNIQHKTTPKEPKTYLKPASKLPQNYPKTFEIGSTPSPTLSFVMSKRRTKINYTKIFGYGLDPLPPFWTMYKRKQLFTNSALWAELV